MAAYIFHNGVSKPGNTGLMLLNMLNNMQYYVI